MSVNIRMDLGNVERKLGNISGKARYAASNQAVLEMNKYVPRLTGHLRDSASISSDGSRIIYNTPYAKAQYYGFVGQGGSRVRNYSTLGTSRRWDLRMVGNQQSMSNVTKAFVKGLLN
ncbi:MAG: hypothetical protein [Caudoviricetes sp.]|nr:MAG: hypothetical protein [Caudoviricetes sp.]